MKDKDLLSVIRSEIDFIDNQIIQAINNRARCAQRVGELKQKQGDKSFYRPEREAQVLRRVIEANTGPVTNEDMALLFRQIMSMCLSMERPLTIAFLGPEGTFTHEAALKHFGKSVINAPQSAIEDVFRTVVVGECDFGVVPVENSTEGMVNQTLDNFVDTTLSIVGEVEIRVHHYLLIGPNSDAKKITRVYSHSQSLAQCRKWLDSNYPKVEQISVSSNAVAAKLAQGEWNSAAIAGLSSCDFYGLRQLNSKIEDQPDNSTRFLIIGRERALASGNDKTSIVVSMHNKPGSLYGLLKIFYSAGIDLTRVESRPAKGSKWSYVFFIDFVGHCDEQRIDQLLKELKNESIYTKLLGSYPQSVV